MAAASFAASSVDPGGAVLPGGIARMTTPFFGAPALAAAAWALQSAPRWLPASPPWFGALAAPGDWGWPATLPGAALLVMGLALAGWAVAALMAGGATWRRGPRILVDEGPYRWVRHPMYLGLSAALAGAGLLLASPVVLVAAAAYAGALWRWWVPAEERALARAFGGWWRDYAAQVRI